MIKTRITELLGIQYPIFQGGMAWVADAALASAVSNAGGLGIIAAMNMNGEQLRAEIAKLRANCDKPFGVNVMLMSPHAAEVAEVIVEEKVPVVTTGAGNPLTYLKKWIEAGVKVIPVVASVALAQMVAKRGAVAVVAEGGESGGHIGEANTMALIPQVADGVEIPVVAAGGIADGRGYAAALMLGAEGIQMGTRFLVANECNIHPNYKAKVLKAGDTSTMVSGRRLGHPVRSLKTPFSRKFAELEKDETVTDEQLSAYGTGALRKAVTEGDDVNGVFMCGQSAGLVKKEQTCREILEEITAQAEEILSGANKYIAGE
ncbi:MAG TPA: enoyl-[acyl-carrier-protein] reductase FabK [Candidatus Coproplasma excrementigallinarum]|uniref:Probable nitronate monooxygenase n=1 Tax=Candidatus Coproplasma excrementigallinarum TaxID=2840747 RepID=A0A9D1MKE7_9FIRM|nr:enoyl-[acyl-carrier-protein] reductase FabK [Candidatus Coproplasma excrementigallinarum]